MDKAVFTLQPAGREFEEVYYGAIVPVVLRAGDQAIRFDREAPIDKPTNVGWISDSIDRADVLIANVTDSDPNVMYELGYAHARHKSVILVSQTTSHVPFDVRGVGTLYYDPGALVDFSETLRGALEAALTTSAASSQSDHLQIAANSIFVSYSHKDHEFLQRVLVHLRPLEKQGLIDIWVDKKIAPGEKWNTEIERALSRARVALLLVSPDFLASDFIVDHELPSLLLSAKKKGLRVVPLILKPCRFARDKVLSQFQSGNDPTESLVTLSEGEQEMVLDRLAELLETT